MNLALRVFTAPGDWSFLEQFPGWSREEDRLTNGSCILLDEQEELIGVWVTETGTESEYVLNHIAYAGSDLSLLVPGFVDHPGGVFIDHVNWDPILDTPIHTIHFCKENDYYVTLREDEKGFHAHHIGFECSSVQAVDDAEKLLDELGMNIFWKGEVDGSYVVHFFGPDGRIHDFFHVLQSRD